MFVSKYMLDRQACTDKELGESPSWGDCTEIAGQGEVVTEFYVFLCMLYYSGTLPQQENIVYVLFLLQIQNIR